jgi:lipoprotein NlpI
MHAILGLSAYYQGDFASAVEHLSAGDNQNNMVNKYYLAKANESAGNADQAAQLFSELAVYNFNSPGFALFRKKILNSVAAD